ncbi:MAG: GH3 auxin-responsive promoter family protein [Blastochloris sp.]|nr:GH3 auxin-responsive promoter family protein [Blastochloris sp.]
MFRPLTRLGWELLGLDCQRGIHAFDRALRDPQAAQTNHFQSIMTHADGTAWARSYGLHARSSIHEFRQRVPVQEPSELEPWTDRIRKGESHILTNTEIERLVPTSGTTGPSKLIPMTRASRKEYSTAVKIWLGDCLRHCPAIKNGRAYLATSPALDYQIEPGPVPVGFARDSDYLGGIGRMVLGHILAVPISVAGLREEAWRNTTRESLFRASDLSFVSLWHPSYWEALFSDEELTKLADTWPQLKLISTWADGACQGAARKLLKKFPKAAHASKGLWLTEGAVSVPWKGGCPVALLSGFSEFEDAYGNLFLAHELNQNQNYRPILTNHAGLYRYRLGDLIRVDGSIHQTPSIRWIGRADKVSDLRGEKISDAQVALALQQIIWRELFLLLPVEEADPPHYLCLVCEGSSTPFPVSKMEEALKRNPHYAWAREVKQLGGLALHHVPPDQISEIKRTLDRKSNLHSKSTFIITKDTSADLFRCLSAGVRN